MSETDVCDFGKLLKTLCNKLDFTRTVGIKKFAEFTLDEQDILLWRAGLVDENKEGMNICFHHEHLFGDVFERRFSNKCCGILISHQRKAKGERMITLEMARQLKDKNIQVIPGHALCRQ